MRIFTQISCTTALDLGLCAVVTFDYDKTIGYMDKFPLLKAIIPEMSAFKTGGDLEVFNTHTITDASGDYSPLMDIQGVDMKAVDSAIEGSGFIILPDDFDTSRLGEKISLDDESMQYDADQIMFFCSWGDNDYSETPFINPKGWNTEFVGYVDSDWTK